MDVLDRILLVFDRRRLPATRRCRGRRLQRCCRHRGRCSGRRDRWGCTLGWGRVCDRTDGRCRERRARARYRRRCGRVDRRRGWVGRRCRRRAGRRRRLAAAAGDQSRRATYCQSRGQTPRCPYLRHGFLLHCRLTPPELNRYRTIMRAVSEVVLSRGGVTRRVRSRRGSRSHRRSTRPRRICPGGR